MLLRAIRLSGGRFQPDGADDGFRRAGAEDMAGRRAIVARKRAGRGLRPGAVPALQEQHASRGADLGAPPVDGAERILRVDQPPDTRPPRVERRKETDDRTGQAGGRGKWVEAG